MTKLCFPFFVLLLLGLSVSAQSREDSLYRAITSEDYALAIDLINRGVSVNYEHGYKNYDRPPHLPRNPKNPAVIFAAPVIIIGAIFTGIKNARKPMHYVTMVNVALSMNKTPERDQLIALMIAKGANPDLLSDGDHPLDLATMQNDTEMSLLLLDNGAKLNSNAYNNKPLHYAVQFENEPLIDRFLQADLNFQIKVTPSQTPLALALGTGNQAIMQRLMDHGDDPNTTLQNGNTILHFAIKEYENNRFQHLNSRQLLALVEMVDPYRRMVHQQNSEGNTPLHLAIQKKRDDLLPLLLIQEMDSLDYVNAKGLTPLALAVQLNKTHLVKMMVQAGADPYATSPEGQSAAAIAAQGWDAELMTMLGMEMAKAKRNTLELQTLMQKKDINKKATMAKAMALIEDTVLPNSLQVAHKPMLHYVVGMGNVTLAKSLLEAGANVDGWYMYSRRRPINIAFDQRNLEMMQLLIAYHADPTQANLLSSLAVQRKRRRFSEATRFETGRYLLAHLVEQHYIPHRYVEDPQKKRANAKKYIGKWGFADSLNHVNIEHLYDTVHAFNDQGHALVKLKGRWQVIGFHKERFFSEGYDTIVFLPYTGYYPLAKVRSEKGWQLADTRYIQRKWMKLNALPAYDHINDPDPNHKGLAIAQSQGKYGVIDKHGMELLVPLYDEVKLTGSQKHAMVRLGTVWRKEQFK